MLTGEVLARLKAPIPEEEISFKPQTMRDDKALMVGYVDARWVAERLDQATDGDWSFEWEAVTLADDRVAVRGRLTVMDTVREDVGEYRRTRETDEIEMLKAAVSDALKRCAVLFGVGRELYRMPTTWVAWDNRPGHKCPVDGEMERVRRDLGQRRDGQQSSDEPQEAAQKAEPPKSAEGPVKWDSQTITRFWKLVREKGKDQKSVLAAVGGNIVTYTGTWDDLMALVDGQA